MKPKSKKKRLTLCEIMAETGWAELLAAARKKQDNQVKGWRI
jgi:hypothetical protein